MLYQKPAIDGELLRKQIFNHCIGLALKKDICTDAWDVLDWNIKNKGVPDFFYSGTPSLLCVGTFTFLPLPSPYRFLGPEQEAMVCGLSVPVESLRLPCPAAGPLPSVL